MRESYDFVEIGTSDFDTLIQVATDSTKGISVEPHKVYLDRLPTKAKVNKVNAALVTEKQFKKCSETKLYYVDEKDIAEFNLGQWLKGCNSIGEPHEFHINWYPAPGFWKSSSNQAELETINLLEKGLVQVQTVRCVTFGMLAEEFNIGQIDLLKTDTEGLDATLLRSILRFYIRNDLKELLPKRILFEAYTHRNIRQVKGIKSILRGLGYKLKDLGSDCFAVRN